MKRIAAFIFCVLLIASISSSVFAEAPVVGNVGRYYPLLGDYTPPEGSSIIIGEVIGAELGWEDNPYTNALSAFDADHGNIYDQRVTGDYENEYAGIKANKRYILTAVRILPVTDVDWQANRMNGMAIQGSDDGDTWVTLWQSDKAATIGDNSFITVSDFANNDGYIMFRVCNITGDHTAYRELQLFGYSNEPDPVVTTVVTETAEPDTSAAEESETGKETEKETDKQTEGTTKGESDTIVTASDTGDTKQEQASTDDQSEPSGSGVLPWVIGVAAAAVIAVIAAVIVKKKK